MQSHEIHQFALRAVELKRQGRIDDSVLAYCLVFAVADDTNRLKNYGGFAKSLFVAGKWQDSMAAFQALMALIATSPSGREDYELACQRAGTCQLQVARQSGRVSVLVRSERLPEHQIDTLVRHMTDSFMGREDQPAFDSLLQAKFRVGDVFSTELQAFASSKFDALSGDVIPLMIVLRVLGTYSMERARRTLLSLGRTVDCHDVELAVGFKCVRQSAEGRQAVFRMMESWGSNL